APVVAFMVSSPLTSPSEYVWSVGLFGADFATTYFVAAIVIGLAAGALTAVVERSGLLRGQERVRPAVTGCSDGCGGPVAGVDESLPFEGPASVPSPGGRTMLAELRTAPATCCTAVAGAPVVGSASVPAAGLAVVARSRLGDLERALVLNARRLAVYFLGFATLGYLVIELVPTHLLTSYLGGGSFLSVPLAATLGVPVYLSSDGSLPLVASLLHGGMGPGAALAFLVTGAGTSVGAISGMLVIARWRVVALVVGCLWVGAVLLGYLAPLWL
ncbi:MAG TPA: permease, partial [Propionicimonas sp.]